MFAHTAEEPSFSAGFSCSCQKPSASQQFQFKGREGAQLLGGRAPGVTTLAGSARRGQEIKQPQLLRCVQSLPLANRKRRRKVIKEGEAKGAEEQPAPHVGSPRHTVPRAGGLQRRCAHGGLPTPPCRGRTAFLTEHPCPGGPRKPGDPAALAAPSYASPMLRELKNRETEVSPEKLEFSPKTIEQDDKEANTQTLEQCQKGKVGE